MKPMRILLTNDDGIEAEGLGVLRRIAAQLSDDVWVCAPEQEQSGAGRALSMSDPVRIRQIEAKVFAVAGTPTDCVMIALQDLVTDPLPDLVLSGVNSGHNLGEDVTLSGTVAGALQGMTMGIPSIALSQALSDYHEKRTGSLAVAEHFAPGLIQRLLDIGWPKGVILNVNFPPAQIEEVKAVEVTAQGKRDYHHMQFERRTDLRGRNYYWLGFRQDCCRAPKGVDLHAIDQKAISVTPLHIDLTHKQTLTHLKSFLGGTPPILTFENKP